MSSISSELFTKSQVLASECIQYLTKCVSPYHCVSETIRFLDGCGFRRLSEKENWNSELLRNGRYYVTRNESTLAAFLIGGNFDTQNGVKIVGAHTDSPNLHLKPVTSNTRSGYEGVQVQLYGGGLWHTWFDRDLGIAGKLIYRKKSGPDAQSVLHTKLVCVAQPILRIPTLAIHLTETEERTSFAPHKENHIAPILATSVINAVCGPEASVTPSNDESLQNKEGKIQTSSRCSAPLTRLLFDSIDEDPECTELVDFDLNLFDAVAPVLGGLHKEFIFSGRIDNLLSCYAATRALLESIHTNDDGQGLATDTRARMIALFDHEEVGSCSAEGADSSFIPDILQRIVSCPLFATKGSGDVQSVRPVFHANSFFISADGAHALHPNYSERHQAQHAPNLQHGVVIKKNANVRYATNAFTSAMVREIARRRKIPVQEFCVKNNSPCGSTIGPMIAAATGIPTVDIGAPMLSMHSIREMCGVVDLWYLKEVLHEYFVSFEKITITGPSV